MQKTLAASRLRACIVHAAFFDPEFKSPQEFRDCDEQPTLGQMYAWTNAPRRAVAEMITILSLGGGCVERCKMVVVGVALWDKAGRIRVFLRVVVQRPDIEDDGAVTGKAIVSVGVI
jgi:hypothetical protein